MSKAKKPSKKAKNSKPSSLGTVTVIADQSDNASRWEPTINGEVEDLLQNLSISDQTRNDLKAKAKDILSKCLPPTERNCAETGLVMGYVQSGKTMSFTTLTALARDSKYQMVIVITGTSTLLFRQSVDRLRKDLRIDNTRQLRWLFLENPNGTKAPNVRNKLSQWHDPDTPDALKQTVLVTVMKNATRIQNLIDFLNELDLTNTTAIVIDDEADQASLNTLVTVGDRSRTYERILALRGALPNHSYVQYTATPQAPLLINIIDNLSPRFVELLDPGPEYVGGEAFFVDRPDLLLDIPITEIPSTTNELHEPPPSLLQALRLFYLGASHAIADDTVKYKKRSMMVHPSQARTGHRQFYQWVRAISEDWHSVLSSDSEDRDQLLNEFEVDYQELRRTAPGVLPFDSLKRIIKSVIGSTHIEEINSSSGRTPPVDWSGSHFHILVGGQSMDRGFTVEGLTITYMPRGRGIGNADTIQQRARFFGYKRSYLDYCRIFLETDVRESFRSYVVHEQDIRNRLVEHNRLGKPLSEWKRSFFLTNDLRPTRTSVINLDYSRGNFDSDWFKQDYPVFASGGSVHGNRELVDSFCDSVEFGPDEGHPRRTRGMVHNEGTLKLSELFENLLVPYKMPHPKDSQRYTGLLLQIKEYLSEHPNADAAVYVMSPEERRKRSVTTDGRIATTLFQGANPSRPRPGQDQTYPGDGEIKHDNLVTVQIHKLSLENSAGTNVAENIPTLAVWAPSGFGRDWYVQQEEQQ